MLFLGYSPNKNLSPSTLLRNILIVSSVISYTLYEFLSLPLSLLEDNDPALTSIIHFPNIWNMFMSCKYQINFMIS